MALRDQFPVDVEQLIRSILPSSLFLTFILLIFGAIFVLFPLLIVIAAFGLGFWFFFWFVIGSILALWLVIYFGSIWYTRAYYKKFFYDVSNGTFIIRKGVFTTTETSLLLGKINDVNIMQDFIGRFYGLYIVNISTASGPSTMRSMIGGLSKQNAEGLRDHILAQVKKN